MISTKNQPSERQMKSQNCEILSQVVTTLFQKLRSFDGRFSDVQLPFKAVEDILLIKNGSIKYTKLSKNCFRSNTLILIAE